MIRSLTALRPTMRALVPLSTIILASMLETITGHGAMQWPPTWHDAGGKCGLGKGCFNNGIFWFTNNTFIPGKPTVPNGVLRTYPNPPGAFENMPWRAPGSAPIFSPCGIEGGNPHGCPSGVEQPVGTPCPGGGSAYGTDALNASFPDVVTTEWAAGSTVEVAWGIRANHGGGYSYRLCKRSDGLSEDCFQRIPLDFVGDEQFVQWGVNESMRVTFQAHRTNEGTTPTGSQWTKNPIPACDNFGGGMSTGSGGDTCEKIGTQFPSPARSLETGNMLEGFCESSATGWRADCNYAIVDKVRVPKALSVGEYVLSFRWDCEQTGQVWTTCASIRITSS